MGGGKGGNEGRKGGEGVIRDRELVWTSRELGNAFIVLLSAISTILNVLQLEKHYVVFEDVLIQILLKVNVISTSKSQNKYRKQQQSSAGKVTLCLFYTSLSL